MGHYIFLTVPNQDCHHSPLGLRSVPGVASQELVPRAVPTELGMGLVEAPGPLPFMLREGL